MDPLNPVDIVVLAGLLSVDRSDAWTQLKLANALQLSPATTFRAVQRLGDARLWDPAQRRADRAGAEELLVHGVRYVFPGSIGPLARGVPTAHAGPPLRDLIVAESPYVWPWDEGDATGPAIEPLHPRAPLLRASFPAVYELLTLVDALRVGRVRERQLAAKEIRARLGLS